MKFLNNLKVGLRMGIGFGLLVIIIFFIGISWYFSASGNMKTINELAEVRLPSLVHVMTMEYEFEKVVSAQRTLLSSENDMATRSRQYENIDESRKKYTSAIELYEPLYQTEDEKKEWDQPQFNEKTKVLIFADIIKQYRTITTIVRYQKNTKIFKYNFNLNLN